MIKTAVFNAEDEDLIGEAIEGFAKRGYQVAGMSNAGLEPGLVRITWVGEQYFKRSNVQEGK